MPYFTAGRTTRHATPYTSTIMDDAAKAAKRAEIEAKVAAMKAAQKKMEVRGSRVDIKIDRR